MGGSVDKEANVAPMGDLVPGTESCQAQCGTFLSGLTHRAWKLAPLSTSSHPCVVGGLPQGILDLPHPCSQASPQAGRPDSKKPSLEL